MEIESRTCAICFENIENNQSLIRCRRCPLLIDFNCFLEYEMIKSELFPKTVSIDEFKDYLWEECNMCKNMGKAMKCYFCGENYGFFLEFVKKKTGEMMFFHPVCGKDKGRLSLICENGHYELHDNDVDLKNDHQYNKENNKENGENYQNDHNEKEDNNNDQCIVQIFKHESQEKQDNEFNLSNFSSINSLEENNKFKESTSLSKENVQKTQKEAILIEDEESETENELDNFFLFEFFKGAMNKDILHAFHQENLDKSIDDLIIEIPNSELNEETCSNREPLFKIITVNQLIVTNSIEYIPSLIKQIKIPSFQSILAKIKGSPIYRFSDLIKDFSKIVHYSLKNRCQSKEAFNYINYQNFSMMKLIDNTRNLSKGKIFKQILDKTSQNLSKILSRNLDFKQKSQPVSNHYRFYQRIKYYVSGIPEDESLLDKIRANKNPFQCPENCCCFNIEKMGCFSLEKSAWKSKCPNRKENMECGYQSHKGKCWNMSISMLKAKELGLDVEERVCWGVDSYTRNLLVEFLSYKIKDERKYKFIQYDLIKALNTMGEDGWDIARAVKFIQTETNGLFEEEAKRIAKKTEKILNMKLTDENLKAHSKGQGLICINREGFKRNEFIIEYFGELYPPWRWFEKQDLIRKKMKENNQADLLFDFYNIMLETHKNDPKGYNLLFVDPIHKGNFSSRLSHSCDPNCGTVTTISNGNYIIAMFAMKDISFGEELTFDYCSYTEDLNECRKAICLCGAQNCRGSYLEFSKSKGNLMSLEKLLPFLKRQKLVLTACSLTTLTAKQASLLEEYNIRENLLKDCPKWLEIWISLVLEFIDEEKKTILSKNSIEKNILATNISENRLQNLVISVDKIKYFLKTTEEINIDPPLKLLNNIETLNILWGRLQKKVFFNNPDYVPKSLIEDLLMTLISNRKDTYLLENLINLILIINPDIQKLSKGDPKKSIVLIRIVLLKLSFNLKTLAKELHKNTFSDDRDYHFLALSDILYFQAFTHCFFKSTAYQVVTSSAVSIRRCELANQQIYRKIPANDLANDGTTQYSEEKVYKSHFIWGQMMYWFRQNTVSPDNSLAHERRGTLVYPSLNESFKKNKMGYPFLKTSKKKVFDMRNSFMSHLKKNPNAPWNTKLQYKWSFRQFNQNQGYGTILFDSVYYAEKIEGFLEKIVKNSDKEFNEQVKFLRQIEKSIDNFDEGVFVELLEILKKCEVKIKSLKNSDTVKMINKLLNKGGMIRRPIRRLNFKNKEKISQKWNKEDEISLGEETEFDYLKGYQGGVFDSMNLKLEEEEIELNH